MVGHREYFDFIADDAIDDAEGEFRENEATAATNYSRPSRRALQHAPKGNVEVGEELISRDETARCIPGVRRLRIIHRSRMKAQPIVSHSSCG